MAQDKETLERYIRELDISSFLELIISCKGYLNTIKLLDSKGIDHNFELRPNAKAIVKNYYEIITEFDKGEVPYRISVKYDVPTTTLSKYIYLTREPHKRRNMIGKCFEKDYKFSEELPIKIPSELIKEFNKEVSRGSYIKIFANLTATVNQVDDCLVKSIGFTASWGMSEGMYKTLPILHKALVDYSTEQFTIHDLSRKYEVPFATLKDLFKELNVTLPKHIATCIAINQGKYCGFVMDGSEYEQKIQKLLN